MATYARPVAAHGAFVTSSTPALLRASPLCSDDAGVRPSCRARAPAHHLRPERRRRLARGAGAALAGGRMQFVVQRSGAPESGDADLARRPHVRNALAAIAVATELRLPDARCKRALRSSRASGPPFERHGELFARTVAASGSSTTRPPPGREAAVLARRARRFPWRRLVLAFQPTATRARPTASTTSWRDPGLRRRAADRGLRRGRSADRRADGHCAATRCARRPGRTPCSSTIWPRLPRRFWARHAPTW